MELQNKHLLYSLVSCESALKAVKEDRMRHSMHFSKRPTTQLNQSIDKPLSQSGFHAFLNHQRKLEEIDSQNLRLYSRLKNQPVAVDRVQSLRSSYQKHQDI